MIIVGMVHVLPSIYVPLRLGGEYRGIFPFQSADEEHYDVRIKMAMQGDYRHRNNYLQEGWTREHAGPRFRSEDILGFMGGIAGLGIRSWIFVQRLVFPMIAFILFYLIFRSFRLSSGISIFWAFFNLLAPYLIFGWFEPFTRPVHDFLSSRGFNFIWYEQYAITTPPWSRMVNPQFSGLFFLGGFLAILHLRRKKNQWMLFVVTLILLYINYRLYFYFWTTLGTLVFFLFVFMMIFGEKKKALPLGILTGIGVIVTGIFAWKYLGKFGGKGGFAWMPSHAPVISPGCIIALVIGIIGVPFIKRFPDRFKGTEPLFFAAPLVFIVTMNQNIVTGRIVQPWHYELFTGPLLVTLPLAILLNRARAAEWIRSGIARLAERMKLLAAGLSIIPLLVFFLGGGLLFFYYFYLAPRLSGALFYIGFAAIQLMFFAAFLQVFLTMNVKTGIRKEVFAAFLCAGLSVLAVSQGITRQSYISLRMTSQAQKIQPYAGAFEWLNQNTEPGETVLASFEISERIPLFTHNTVYLCKNAWHERAGSRKKRWNRAVNYFILSGYNEEQFREILEVWPYGYLFWGLRKLQPEKDVYSFGKNNLISPETLKNVLAKFREKRHVNYDYLVDEYSLDYIFFGPEERKFFKQSPSRFSFTEKVYGNSSVTIYKIR